MKNTFTFQLSNDNLGATSVDNIFINEYMPHARGDYVKVYLYGLKAARNGNTDPIDHIALAGLFGISEIDVVNAWEYWQKEGILSVKYDNNHNAAVTFFHIPSILLNNNRHADDKHAGVRTEREKQIKKMYQQIEILYGSRLVPQADCMTFKRWVNEDGFEPQAIVLLVEYAFKIINKKAEPFSAPQVLKYMSAIAEKWHRSGLHTYDACKHYIEKSKVEQKEVYQILKNIGISRDPMRWERDMILSWINKYHFDPELIDLALDRTKKPDIRYINGILMRWHNDGLKTPEAVFNAEKQNPNYKNSDKKTPQDSERSKMYDMMDLADEQWLMEQTQNES